VRAVSPLDTPSKALHPDRVNASNDEHQAAAESETPELDALIETDRRFRDLTLRRTPLGRACVRMYETLWPPLARAVGGRARFARW